MLKGARKEMLSMSDLPDEDILSLYMSYNNAKEKEGEILELIRNRVRLRSSIDHLVKVLRADGNVRRSVMKIFEKPLWRRLNDSKIRKKDEKIGDKISNEITRLDRKYAKLSLKYDLLKAEHSVLENELAKLQTNYEGLSSDTYTPQGGKVIGRKIQFKKLSRKR